MSDAPLRVTRQMFIEEFARQLLILYPGEYTDINRMGQTLTSASRSMDEMGTDKVRGRIQTYTWSVAVHNAFDVLGLGEPTVDKFLAMPKE